MKIKNIHKSDAYNQTPDDWENLGLGREIRAIYNATKMGGGYYSCDVYFVGQSHCYCFHKVQFDTPFEGKTWEKI